ncbi:MAG: type II toxin-antitoxin system VapC family toxin [Actinomycetota bacterium]|nr:type II toxin-antitoxin system VapC family toxin [Actinomycetota bacterium]
MLVVDASALVELLLGRPAEAQVAQHFRTHDFDLHAPHLVGVEVASALRHIVAVGEADAPRATGALTDLLDLPLERHAHEALLPRGWTLRDNLSAYDATYVALAEVLVEGGAPLLTADRRLARAGRAHSDVEVLLVG